MTTETKTGLALLREPFPPNQISLLPKPTKKREEMDKLPKARCPECGNWHATTNVIHLSYVGHAALTDRLLDADPSWSWEPLAVAPEGYPVLDPAGGMWIKLTVCGVTRLGYGHAGDKEGGDAIKEIIGDALRNAAMRFGAALELWHKGELHEPKERGGVAAQVLEVAGKGAISDDRKEDIEKLAALVKDDFNSYGAECAYERIEMEGLEDLEKIYLGTLLPAAVRNPITAYSRNLKRGTVETAKQG